MTPTLTEKWMGRLQRNRLVAVLILVSTVVIAAATLTDSLKNLVGLFDQPSPEEARLKLAGMQVDFTPEAFLKAAEAGDLVLVNLFITGGMDPSLAKYASNGPMPLFYAARENHPDVVEALLKAGAVVTGPGNYALAGAVHSGNTALLKQLLKTPVQPADLVGALTEGGNREMLEILVAHGADVRKDGAEALRFSPDEEARAYLRAHGADINAKDAAGKTLAERLDFNGISLDTVQRLVAAGADLNTPTREGEKLIHNFAARVFVPGLQLLLDHGADVNAKDAQGHTPLYHASRHHATEAMRLLASRGGSE